MVCASRYPMQAMSEYVNTKLSAKLIPLLQSLFHGPLSTCKTSLSSTLPGVFGLDIYCLR
jgi:hypothetical protein